MQMIVPKDNYPSDRPIDAQPHLLRLLASSHPMQVIVVNEK